MIWRQLDNVTWRSGPFEIKRRVRGMEVWWHSVEGLRCLKREIPTLSETHAFVNNWVKGEKA